MTSTSIMYLAANERINDLRREADQHRRAGELRRSLRSQACSSGAGTSRTTPAIAAAEVGARLRAALSHLARA